MSPVSRATRRQSRATAAPTSTAGRPKTTAQRARPVASAAPVVAVELAVRNGANEDEMEVIPADYVADKLTELGSTFFDSAMGANCKLVVECENGTFRSYWGHELFLAWKSGYFRAVFSALHARAAATAGQESKTTSEYSNDEETAPAVWPVIRVPVSNANFEEMLYWIYTGDDDRWLRSFTKQNFKEILIIVKRLGLGADAVNVCKRFVISSRVSASAAEA